MSWVKILFIQKTKQGDNNIKKSKCKRLRNRRWSMAPEWQDQQLLFFNFFFLISKQHYCYRSLFSDFISILDVQTQSCSQLSWVQKATPQIQYNPVLPQQGGAARKWHTHMWLVLWKLRPWAKSNPIPSSAIPGTLIIDQIQMSFHTPEPLQ